MKDKAKWLFMVLLLVALLFGATEGYKILTSRYGALNFQETQNPEEDPEVERFEVPNFTLLDAEEELIEFQDLLGRPMIINFWASWCPFCLEEMPYFETVYQEYGEEIQFMMIDSIDGSRETLAKGKEYLAKFDYTFPVFFDTELDATMAFGIQAYPATFLVDQEGYFVAWINGMTDEETLRLAVDMLLDK